MGGGVVGRASLRDKGGVLLDALEVVGPDTEGVGSGGPSLVVVSRVLDRERDLGREGKGKDGGHIRRLSDVDVVGRDGALLAGLGRVGERVVGVVGVELALVSRRLARSPVGLSKTGVSKSRWARRRGETYVLVRSKVIGDEGCDDSGQYRLWRRSSSLTVVQVRALDSLAGCEIEFTGHAFSETQSLVQDLALETRNSPAPAWMKQGRATGNPRASRPPTDAFSAFH